MDIKYPATIEKQEPSGFLASFVDLEDTFTEGATKEEALFNASEVLSAMLSWRLDNDMPLPEPTQGVKIHYTDEPLGKVRVIPDFLPPPEELEFREEIAKF